MMASGGGGGVLEFRVRVRVGVGKTSYPVLIPSEKGVRILSCR